ncbi:MAG: hypothetical protein U1E23_12150 [Reyranellaceae bacterium]
MSIDPEGERMRRLDRDAAPESGPADPKPARPRAARGFLTLGIAALVVAALVLGWMFVNNVRYDGSSPAPVAERH